MLNLVYKNDGDTRAIRVVLIADEPWFVLADVCFALEIGNSRAVAGRLDEDQKGVNSIDTLGGKQSITVISESGLWAVILGAKKNPKTKPFQDWVTREVLPTIRKTGTYSLQPQPAPELPNDPLSLALKAALETREALLVQDKKLGFLEQSINILEQRMGEESIRSDEINQIYKLGQRLGKLMGGYDKAWRLFKERFNLASYRDLKRKQFADGVRFLELQIGAYSDSVQTAQERLVSP